MLDAVGLFSTFSTPWFSAIYLLLFVSLVGCVVPRTKHHFDALRARPPKTPARLQRLAGFATTKTGADAGVALDEAAKLLRRQGYRIERYEGSVSAERGYLRETGNLVFHSGARRDAHHGRHRRRIRLHRPAGRRAGRAVHERALRLRRDQPGSLLHRVVPRALLAAARRVRRALPARRIHRALAPHRLRGAGQRARARRRLDARHHQGELAAHGGRHRDLPARQRLRAGHHRAGCRRRGGLLRRRAVPAARREPAEPRSHQGARRARRTGRDAGVLLPGPDRPRGRHLRVVLAGRARRVAGHDVRVRRRPRTG